MIAFEDIWITGLDDTRLPRVRKEAYIDLHFTLSAQPPESWCEEFNALGRGISPEVKIDKTTRLSVDSYVNDMERIPLQLDEIQKIVADSNRTYREKIRQRAMKQAAENAELEGQGGAQHRLNQIVASLVFGK